jgi:hypothetical protein
MAQGAPRQQCGRRVARLARLARLVWLGTHSHELLKRSRQLALEEDLIAILSDNLEVERVCVGLLLLLVSHLLRCVAGVSTG